MNVLPFVLHFSILWLWAGLTRTQLLPKAEGGTWHASDPPWKPVKDSLYPLNVIIYCVYKSQKPEFDSNKVPNGSQHSLPMWALSLQLYMSAHRLHNVRPWKMERESLISRVYVFKNILFNFSFEIIQTYQKVIKKFSYSLLPENANVLHDHNYKNQEGNTSP